MLCNKTLALAGDNDCEASC